MNQSDTGAVTSMRRQQLASKRDSWSVSSRSFFNPSFGRDSATSPVEIAPRQTSSKSNKESSATTILPSRRVSTGSMKLTKQNKIKEDSELPPSRRESTGSMKAMMLKQDRRGFLTKTKSRSSRGLLEGLQAPILEESPPSPKARRDSGSKSKSDRNRKKLLRKSTSMRNFENPINHLLSSPSGKKKESVTTAMLQLQEMEAFADKIKNTRKGKELLKQHVQRSMANYDGQVSARY